MAPKPKPPALSVEALTVHRGLLDRERQLWARAMSLAPYSVQAARIAAELEADIAQTLRKHPELTQ